MDCFYCNVCTVPVLYYSKLSQQPATTKAEAGSSLTPASNGEVEFPSRDRHIQLLPTTARRFFTFGGIIYKLDQSYIGRHMHSCKYVHACIKRTWVGR
jgi:hypothetical protein